MKRIKAACILQTVHFMIKDDLDDAVAREMVQHEYIGYKRRLEQSRTQYKITDEQMLPDGSIMIKIKKQYNATPVGDYLD